MGRLQLGAGGAQALDTPRLVPHLDHVIKDGFLLSCKEDQKKCCHFICMRTSNVL